MSGWTKPLGTCAYCAAEDVWVVVIVDRAGTPKTICVEKTECDERRKAAV